MAKKTRRGRRTMLPVWAQRANQLRQEAGLAMGPWAAKCGKARLTILRMEAGVAMPAEATIWAVARAGGVAPEWLRGDTDARGTPVPLPPGVEAARNDVTEIPVVGIAGADPRGLVQLDDTHRQPLRIQPGLKAVRVQGRSMEPVARHGQIVIFGDDEPADGDLAIVEVRGDDLLIKRLSWQPHLAPPMWHLQDANPSDVGLIVPPEHITRWWRVWGVKF